MRSLTNASIEPSGDRTAALKGSGLFLIVTGSDGPAAAVAVEGDKWLESLAGQDAADILLAEGFHREGEPRIIIRLRIRYRHWGPT